MKDNLMESIEGKINKFDKLYHSRLKEEKKYISRSNDLDKAISLKKEIIHSKWTIGAIIIAGVVSLGILNIFGCLNIGSILALSLGCSVFSLEELYSIHCQKDRLKKNFCNVSHLNIEEIKIYQETLKEEASNSHIQALKMLENKMVFEKQLSDLIEKKHDYSVNTLDDYLNQYVDYSNVHFNNNIQNEVSYGEKGKTLVKK